MTVCRCASALRSRLRIHRGEDEGDREGSAMDEIPGGRETLRDTCRTSCTSHGTVCIHRPCVRACVVCMPMYLCTCIGIVGTHAEGGIQCTV